ncbi:MAG: hypothetical protein E3J45_00720 [Candidatus Zixiibacteriota bacterium]|nr:MAG: hypothetical protein E3J45_00720 [candidate division Zixibacteria bacterium]
MSFNVPRAARGEVRLSIYDLQGRLLGTLLSSDDRWERYEVSWDGRTGGSQQVGSGVYLCVLSCRGKILKSAKIAFIK